MSESLTNTCLEIREARLREGISQQELADLAGVERSQISRIESNDKLGVAFETIEKVLNALNMTLVASDFNKRTLPIHPFVKWAGGKTQLLNKIGMYMPEKYNRYFEPFVGGGALLFKIQPREFYINDTNIDLISAYRCFLAEDSFEGLKKELDKHEANHSKEYYLKIRNLDREEFYFPSVIERAGRMIYLNKACFNGLYRVNSQGYFNVPFGQKEKVICYNHDNFENLRTFFKKSRATITNVDFEDAVKRARAGDFVYFDPPYDNPDDKESFTSYTKEDFTKEDQKRLARVYKELSDKGVYVMLSNHNTAFIRSLYEGYNIHTVDARRAINSDGNGRGVVEEVLITNYE